ncbi:MAG: hypothetical protein IPO64_10800 [Bacteroidetes bacterium]|nr:hypothetical protein [Bacteroidota bacterium]
MSTPNKEINHYKFGIFYYNPNDGRIIVPKRIKYLGWTLNFANPLSYGIIIAIFAIIFLVKQLA